MAAYGADEFPAFFTRHSGCRAPARLDSPDMAAAMIRHNVELSLGSGAVIGAGLLHCPSIDTHLAKLGSLASVEVALLSFLDMPGQSVQLSATRSCAECCYQP